MGLFRAAPLWWLSTHGLSTSTLEWPSNLVRRTFIDYFKSLGYTYVQSSSIVPYDDQSLLYVTAGMNQFKPIFLGTLNPTAKRAQLRLAVNSQKCVRVVGRDKELQQVGRDGYHHTFFEMLGSWSFSGHLPKKEACRQMLRLLTDVYRLSKERLFVTYFEGYEPFGLLPDVECKELWRELGVDADHILGRGVEDNFWEMSPAGGPCGPCSEILYSPTNPPRADETVELWNIVFMQYNKLSDGKLTPLPVMHIDTGMGLERLCCVLQRVKTTYDTDLFVPLLKEIETLSGAPRYNGLFGDADKSGIDTAYRIVADHARMFTVAVADGLIPGESGKEANEHSQAGRILRRVIRSAAYQSSVLAGYAGPSTKPLSLKELCATVATILGQAYPELHDHLKYVQEVVAEEETKFYALTTRARVRLALLIKDSGGNLSTSDLVSFYLADDLPYAAFVAMAKKRGLKVNLKEFENEVEKYLQKTSGIHKPAVAGAGPENEAAKVISSLQASRISMTDDSYKYQVNRDSTAHYTIPTCESKVLAIIHNNNLAATAPPNEECDIVLDRTPFFAECTGQAGDRGTLRWGSAVFNVKDTFARGGYVFHTGLLSMGGLARSDVIQAFVNSKWRLGCTQHNTAVQLMVATLERILGPVRQRSKTLDANSAKLSFWCATVATPELLFRVEREANEAIRRNPPVYTEEMPLEKAKQCTHIRWLIGEYYPDTVRCVGIGVPPRRLLDPKHHVSTASVLTADGTLKEREGPDVEESLPPSFVSAQLSSGTNVLYLGDIQKLRIISLEGSGSSVKTVTFAVGAAALAAEQRGKKLGEEISVAWEKVRNGTISADTLLELRAKVVDAVIPLETRTHLLHNILDFRKSHLKQLLETQSQTPL